MKKYAVIFGAICFSNIVLAENKGIEDTNYSVSASVSDSDNGNAMSFSGGVRLPVANYTGVTISGSYSDFNGKNNYTDSSSNSVSLGIFFRKYDLGIISASYGHSRSKSDYTTGNSENSINAISLSGTYYFKEFDLGLERLTADPDSGKTLNTLNASISYYVNDNLRVGASVQRMDADASAYFISYQPELFGNNTNLSASYQNSETNKGFSVSVAYHFGTKVSLKDRIRKY